MTSTIILISAFAVIAIYVAAIAIKYGIQKSISYSDYILKKPFRWVFEGVLSYCGVALMLSSYLLFGNITNLLMLSGLLIFGVAVFARYSLSKFYGKAHIFCATFGLGALALVPAVQYGDYLLSGATAITTILTHLRTKGKKSQVFWTEVVVIAFSFGALLASIALQ